MIPGVQPKISVSTDEDGNLKIDKNQAELLGIVDNEYNWRLVRERDNLTKESKEIMWIEWNEDSTFKSKHDEIAVGRSLMMSPFNQYFTWMTTEITEVWETTEDFIKFKTLNSKYTLYKLK